MTRAKPREQPRPYLRGWPKGLDAGVNFTDTKIVLALLELFNYILDIPTERSNAKCKSVFS